jgi:hypothetical protein
MVKQQDPNLVPKQDRMKSLDASNQLRIAMFTLAKATSQFSSFHAETFKSREARYKYQTS